MAQGGSGGMRIGVALRVADRMIALIFEIKLGSNHLLFYFYH